MNHTTKIAWSVIGIGIIILIIGALIFKKDKPQDTMAIPVSEEVTSETDEQTETQLEHLSTSHPTKKTFSMNTIEQDINTTLQSFANLSEVLVTLETNKGPIVIEMDITNTPMTSANFVTLAETGFYNGVKFHRIIPDFMIQGGDPNSKDDARPELWGRGGPGYQFGDEIKATNNNLAGTISMANAGPNTNGSQFFINVADNTFLNPKHTVFGKVISGYDLVQSLSTVPTDSFDRPLDPIVIINAQVSKK